MITICIKETYSNISVFQGFLFCFVLFFQLPEIPILSFTAEMCSICKILVKT